MNDWNGLNDNQQFFVEAFSLNGRDDESNIDNKLFSNVKIPPVLPDEFLLKIKTNNFGRAKQNTYEIKDYSGNILFSNYSLLDSTVYDIAISLDPGFYKFIFTDSSVPNFVPLGIVAITGKCDFSVIKMECLGDLYGFGSIAAI